MKKNVHSATYGSDVRSRPAALEDRTIKRRGLLCPLSMLACGLLLGAAARLFDIFCPTLGEIFSQMSVWILLGTLIAIYSPTMKDAALNILPFCFGMLFTYYAAAMLTHGVYGWSFIIGWTVFALLSPLMACFAHITKRCSVIPKVIGVGIVLVSVASGILLFDRLRIYDIIIDGLLVYFIFFAKTGRQIPQNENKEDVS
ncbi:MAG: DUF6518 family protein [Eubacteriales bacterium]